MTISIIQIIGAALANPRVLVALRNVLVSDLVVANPHQRQIVEFTSQFYTDYKSLPTTADYQLWMETLSEQQAEGVRQTLGELTGQLGMGSVEWTPEYLNTTVSAILREVAARNAVARLGTMVPDVPVDALSILADQVRAIEPVSIHGLTHLSDVEEWVYRAADDTKVLPTGSKTLDRYIGGWRQELIFVMADLGIGKTALLVNFGAAAALYGARVLHLTFELSAENTIRRYYRRIAEVDTPTLRRKPELVVDRMHHWLSYAKGEVHVLYQPAYSVGSQELGALIEQFIHLYGEVDMIILDYLDLMKPPTGPQRSTYEAQGILSHEVRNFAPQYEASVLSATQAAKTAHGRRHLRVDMVSDSYQKPRAADIVIALAQTVEEFEVNQGRLEVLKVRENPGRGLEIPIYINMDLMLIADLDDPNTQRIVAELGHQAVPVEHKEGG